MTPDITTDEVIITDTQIGHINDRHPGDYETFSELIPQIISCPDYLLRANKPDSVVVLKQFDKDGKRFKIILRLKTVRDDPERKNSVITFWKVKQPEWNRLLRNGEILYKHLDKSE